MSAPWIGGVKLDREQMKEFNRRELRAQLWALVLGMLFFILNVEVNRHYLHDSVATVHVFFAGVMIILFYLLFQIRYLVAMRIREDVSRKENKEVS
jgi:hypothetical protein